MVYLCEMISISTLFNSFKSLEKVRRIISENIASQFYFLNPISTRYCLATLEITKLY